MVHEFYLTGTNNKLNFIEENLDKHGVLSFLSSYYTNDNSNYFKEKDIKKESLDDAKGLFSYQRIDSNEIVIKAFSFNQDYVIFPGFCLSLSKSFSELKIRYKFHKKGGDLCGGADFQSGKYLSNYIFNDLEDIGYAITDFFCATNISLKKNELLTISEGISSRHLFDEKSPGENPIYVIEVFEVSLINDEKLYMRMEYNEKSPECNSNLKEVENSYKIYGLANVSWTKTQQNNDIEGLLYEYLEGDLSENFSQIIPFDFALDIYKSNTVN